ncbi:MAG TPA: hypothetical protein VFJ15_03840 [Oleiagrimonas sp.]|nr:hypothetical protein [Oleiagrimonas sp.]
MSVKRILATGTREAMQRVRELCGDDALVLANRRTDHGVEILAVAAADADRLGDVSAADSDQLGERLLREVADIRSLLERPRKQHQPDDATLWRRLRVAGFSRRLGETLMASLPERIDDAWLSEQLRRRLHVAATDWLEASRVLALVGPPGVGKTRAAVSLATRHAALHGPGGVALASLPTNRFGIEQLRFLTDGCGIDVHTLDGDRDPGIALPDKRLLIIDSTGFDAGDEGLGRQMRRVGGSAGVAVVLLLDAARQPEVLDETVRVYRTQAEKAGAKLDDVILTHCDQCSRIGPALDVVMRHGLRVVGLRDGAEATQGLREPDARALVTDALAAPVRDDHAEAVPQLHALAHQSITLGRALATLRHAVPGFERLEARWNQRGPCEVPTSDDKDASAHADASAIDWQRSTGRIRRLCALDASGLPHVEGCHQLSTDSWPEALAWVHENLSATTHLLPRVPDTVCWRWLTAHGQQWLASASASHHVWHDGERRSLKACRSRARPAATMSARWRGRDVRVRLHRLAVTRCPGIGPVAPLFAAWFADVCDGGSGKTLATRYWLMPRFIEPQVAMELMTWSLRMEEQGKLVERTFALLQQRPGALPGESTEQLAAELAALARRLDAEVDGRALEAKRQLANLTGSRRRRGAVAVSQAVMAALEARDTLREVSAVIARDGETEQSFVERVA